jgi:hypothetical protein
MKINEVTSIFNTYIATVRVVLCDLSTTARTTVTVDTLQQAKLMLTLIYECGNVLHINQVMGEDVEVTEATTTLSPQELQVKSLNDQSIKLNQQENT